jgi:hypothetical protein
VTFRQESQGACGTCVFFCKSRKFPALKNSLIKISLLLLLGAFFSCAATPPAQDDFDPPGEIEAADDTDDGEDTVESGGEASSGNEAAAEIPEVNLPPHEKEPEEAAGKLEEPFVDLPEIADTPLPPAEAPGAGLEEPAAPAEVPEARQDSGETPSGSAAPPPEELPQPPPPETPPPAPAPEAAKEPPPPPPFIGPVEEELPPREPERPQPPLPDLPARTPPPPAEELVFSRTVRATVGQLVELPFRGTGWVYLGELSSRRGLAYDSRRLDPEGQSFVFRCETPGTYVLKFYRQDFIRDYILNDHVQVIVGEAPERAGIGLFNPPADKARVIAEPRWPPLDREREELSREIPPSPGPAENKEPDAAGTPPETAASDGASPEAAAGGAVPESGQTTDTAADMPPPESYMSRALEEYNAGGIPQALAVMEQFRQRFPAGTGEAWWLMGQLLEANSPARDIRLALEYYRRLIREFPQSPRVPEARRRIAYLNRFYVNIQ